MPRYHLRQTPGADIFDPPLTPCPLSFFLDRPYPRSRYSTQCRPEMDLAQPGDAPPTSTNTAGTLEDSSSTAKRRWRRNRIACDSCHSRRVRCDRAFPCSRCLRSEIRCEFTREDGNEGGLHGQNRRQQSRTADRWRSCPRLPMCSLQSQRRCQQMRRQHHYRIMPRRPRPSSIGRRRRTR